MSTESIENKELSETESKVIPKNNKKTVKKEG